MVLGGFKYCALCDSAGGERLEAAWHRAGTQTEPRHELEGIHPNASGRAGWDRLLHGGGPYLARAGDLLRLVFVHLESRRVSLPGITRHPDQGWMQQMARNATGETWGLLDQRRYALHDRDTKFCAVFRATLASGGIEPIQLPARSPNLNAYAERWVRSVNGECLSKLILFGEASLRRALTDFVDHFHGERNHQGKGNVLLFPSETVGQQKPRSRVRCRERLGGLLRYYSYAA